jgi:hypothetical protein
MLANIYVNPALIGAFAGAFGGTLNAKILAAQPRSGWLISTK